MEYFPKTKQNIVETPSPQLPVDWSSKNSSFKANGRLSSLSKTSSLGLLGWGSLQFITVTNYSCYKPHALAEGKKRRESQQWKQHSHKRWHKSEAMKEPYVWIVWRSLIIRHASPPQGNEDVCSVSGKNSRKGCLVKKKNEKRIRNHAKQNEEICCNKRKN